MFKNNFVKRIGPVLCSRWVVSLVGLFAISLLIWFGGPLIAIAGTEPLVSEVSRLVVLLVLTLLWGAINIAHQARNKHQNAKAVKTLLDGNDEASLLNEATQREIETLRTRIVQALTVLNGSVLKRGKSVYQLPWYILIGPPGTGKTTALHNSGLEFPLKDKLGDDPLAGVGGTRHCDWWFTNQAVLIDTAGRYTTQDSNREQDSKAWFGFLGLLKKHRTRRPINGAIVTVSLVSLLTQTRTERNLHARAIKHRIQELKNQLGMHFPVYVIMTKADLVAGFSEYFADLSAEQREQVWGITFPEQADDPERGVVGMFNKEFHHLLERLVGRMNERMQHTRDIDKRTLIYEFPKQLRLIQAAADDFLKEIFSPNSFEEAPMLRGVYIASATQEGVPIDRVMTEMAGGLGLGSVPLKQPGSESKGFFIKRLFEDVIFPEQYIGTVNRHHQKQNLWLKRGVLGGCCVLMGIMGGLWLTSYKWNKDLVDEAAIAVAQYKQVVTPELTSKTDVITLANALDLLEDLPAGYNGKMLDSDAVKHVGLYQGDKIGQPARAAYERGLQGFFAPYLIHALQQDMKENSAYLEYLYETLKTYLMLFDHSHYEEEQVLSWFALYFERTYPGEINEPIRQSLMGHTTNLLELGIVGVQQDDDAVELARGVLTQMPLAERAYQRLKMDFMDSHIPDYRLTDILGSQSQTVFQRLSGKSLSDGIAGLYTYTGFHSVFQLENKRIVKRLMEDSWVYGDKLQLGEATKQEVMTAVNDKYYRDYIYYWNQLIGDIQLVPYSSAAEGLYQMKVLSGSERPLQSLIVSIQKQLRLTELPISEEAKAAGEVAGHAAGVAMQQKKTRITRYLPSEMPELESALPGAQIEEEFADILAIGDVEFNALNESLTLLHNYLAKLNSTGDNDRVAYKSLLGETSHDDLDANLSQVGDVIPAPFNQWLGELKKQTTKLAKQGSKVHLNTIWQDAVVSEYKKSIKGKYPFNRRSKRDVKIKDFGRFFGYGGILDNFFITYLEPFVDTSKGQWRFTKNVGVSETSLQLFKQAQRIREAFFEPGSKVPHVEFGLKTVFLDQHISNFRFEFGPQAMIYRHGPTRVSSFSWPDTSQTAQVRLVFTPPQSGHAITKTYKGSWGLFRLLEEAARKRSKTRKDKMVEVELKGNRATVQLLPNSVVHPFWLRDIERFSCPMTL
ncbi:type VI secretion protein IcmF [Photobacterium aquae]|uniref:Type VI secretion protein IcmF n=1 Tax=Photobacterium aquae TaxID=1195763 RepID=A0A0J1GVT0_9GAMM|nr:type VI secretion system membrane subunit TssM [Photobacterium aquae]KLV03731.1 type VI secretion protein IcmF [Photobacterium aquae]